MWLFPAVPVPGRHPCEQAAMQAALQGFPAQDGTMNAAEQARSLELAQAIASAATLFRCRFPDARPNLCPWREDAQTRAFVEHESIDLSFHFPGWSPRTQCRSLLVQLRLERAPAAPGSGLPGRPRLLGVILRGHTYDSERWRLATVGDWRPTGSHLPSAGVEQLLHGFCRELFELFGRASQVGMADEQEPESGPQAA